MINKAILLGRLTRDPELKSTTSGLQVVKFTVATSEKYNGKEYTEFHNVTAWDKLAVNCNSYLQEGSMVYVEGKIKTDAQEKDGVKKYFTSINAKTVQFLSSKDEKSTPTTAKEAAQMINKEFTTSEIPF